MLFIALPRLAVTLFMRYLPGKFADPSTLGWAMDGICDGLGDMARFAAFVLVLDR